jgi:hypothetical protein
MPRANYFADCNHFDNSKRSEEVMWISRRMVRIRCTRLTAIETIVPPDNDTANDIERACDWFGRLRRVPL